MKIQLVILGLLFCSVSRAAIYGADDRRDIDGIPTLAQVASAIAITVPLSSLKDFGLDFYKVDSVQTFAQSSQMCSDERFANQPVFDIGTCTGFLVNKRYLITAGHCVLPNGTVTNEKHAFCDAFSWYFDFNTKKQPQTTNQIIRKDQVYRCKRIIRAENIAGGNDFAVMELERRVQTDISSSTLNLRTTPVILNEQVFAIGHPFGLPAKFSGLSPIFSNGATNYFEVNLDSAGGNSGSPVFDKRKHVVGILIEGHPVDTFADAHLNCHRLNRCNDSGTKCLSNSNFPGLSTSNHIQRLDSALKYLPANSSTN